MSSSPYLVAGPDDPSPHARRSLPMLGQPIDSWRNALFDGMADGRPRTFQHLAVEAANRNAIDVFGTNFELAFRRMLIEQEIVTLTRRPPLYFARSDRLALTRLIIGSR